MACNSANKQYFQNLTKSDFTSQNVQSLQNFANLASFLLGNLNSRFYQFHLPVHIVFLSGIYCTLSEEIAHSTVYHHLSQISVHIQLNGLINYREDSGVQMLLTRVIFCLLSIFLYPAELTEIPADSTDVEQVISCSSVSCLINMEPLELLSLQPSEPIASESVS